MIYTIRATNEFYIQNKRRFLTEIHKNEDVV